MPIALLEATASGLPCLVSSHPVVNWMIGPGGDGIEMEGDGELCKALKLYLDDGFRRQKAEAARKHVVENFGQEAIIKRYLDMYRDVLARAKGKKAT